MFRGYVLLNKYLDNAKYNAIYDVIAGTFITWIELLFVLYFLAIAFEKFLQKDNRFINRYIIRLPVTLLVFAVSFCYVTPDILFLWYYLWWSLINDFEKTFAQ